MIKRIKIAYEGVCSADNVPVLLFNGGYSSRHHPPTFSTACLSSLQEPSSPACICGSHAPMWWQPYSGHNNTSASTVAATWNIGVWPGVSAWLPLQFPEVGPTRWRKGRSGGVSGVKPPGTYDFLPFRIQVALRWRLLEIGGGVCIQGTHIKNKVHPFLIEVLDKNISLLFGVHFRR